MAGKLYTAKTLNGGTVTGTHRIDEAVKHESVTSATWQVKHETIREEIF